MGGRKRRIKAKPGELIAYYGNIDGDGDDVVYAWGGSGATKADSNLIYGMFNGLEHRRYGRCPAANDGYLNELEARGYDLSTLRFYIRKKQPEPQTIRKDLCG
mgnify:CR=1 FL=1